ncbi:MAG: hypothetical protein HY755_11115 [Nitrospirae bacterium]|nr:hypothetical protein [Nitrospirota bacterium]
MRKYILIIALIIATAGLFFIFRADSSDKGDHDCIKCHKLTNEEAQNFLKDGIPDVKILEVKPAQIKGLWEVVFEARGQKGILYIDSEKKLLVSGQLFDLKKKTNLTAEKLSEINKVDFSKIPLDDALVMGDKNALKKMVVFTDPE